MQNKVIDSAFHQALSEEIFSGAQVILGQGDKILFEACYGRVSRDSSTLAVTEETLFDIASLTKPLCTGFLIAKLFEQKKLSLSDPVQKYLPKFLRKETMTIEQLLTHRSGLPDWLPIYKEVDTGASYEATRDFYTQRIAETPLAAPADGKRIYSDLGFILLGFVLEQVSGQRLNELFVQEMKRAHVGAPLQSMLFLPVENGFVTEQMAVTGPCFWCGELLQGEVHDENTGALDGVAGHAGLFSNAHAIHEWVQKFITQENLAWDSVSKVASQAGKYFSQQTLGHLGFSGCSLWFDRSDQKYIILLTNRVHYGRTDKIKRFRPMIHDLLVTSVMPDPGSSPG